MGNQNLKRVATVFKDQKLRDNTKLKRSKKRERMITAWNKNNIWCKSYTCRICLSNNQREFYSIKKA